ncbi:MAG: hypothetical protein CFE32_01450 [Alphaproteobacteria bacterium PA3]|nr:MAG: hypothetical protein CFE32_01450 [Alphaproteobacteria bacterium PA3]
MIQRRTLLLSAPFALLSACSKAEAVSTSSDLGATSSSAVTGLAPKANEVVWLQLKGTVRTSEATADVRPAALHRALVRRETSAGTSETKFFDLWQSAGQPAVAGASSTHQLRLLQDGANGFWLEREFTHPALTKGVESSRLARSGARVLVLSGRQVWLLAGGMSTAPTLTADQATQFNAWLTSLGIKRT